MQHLWASLYQQRHLEGPLCDTRVPREKESQKHFPRKFSSPSVSLDLLCETSTPACSSALATKTSETSVVQRGHVPLSRFPWGPARS
ncbi:hypothetical protein AAY473_037501 [Plecturocebus cupreus]